MNTNGAALKFVKRQTRAGRTVMDIKEIAELVSKKIYVEDGLLLSKFISEKFAEALIESYKAELLKEVGEPVGYHYLPNNEMFPVEEVSRSNLKNNPQDYVFLYTSDQLATAQEECEFQRNAHKQAEELMLEQSNQLAAVQEEMNDWRNQAHQSQSAFDRLQDQLAKAEQRVSEACALQVATDTKFRWLDAARVAKEIRSGEWRKFVKEV
jgi:hypothetical protein